MGQPGPAVPGSLPAASANAGGRVSDAARRIPTYVGWISAAILGLALTLPMVRANPLHIDESTTLEYAPRTLTSVVHDIFVSRGGAPLQFIAAHFTLQWPGGIEGLRSAVSPLRASGDRPRRSLGCAARRARESIALAFLLASAPLAAELATFGRMYGMFLFAVLGASLLSLRAGRRGGQWDWALAGAAAGALVYVHPIAPVYAPFALADRGRLLHAPLRSFAQSARAAILAAALVAAPYVWALAVLTRRYDVGTGNTLAAKGDRPIVLESLLGMTPGGNAIAAIAAALVAIGIVSIWRQTPRLALLLALWIAFPLAFFSVVTANTRFFVRYVIPALPPLLLLVAAGAFALGRRIGRPCSSGRS